MNFMSEGSLFDRIFSFLGRLILLNLLWIVCSLPVVTAGASTTALFYCVLKLHKDGDINTLRDFFKSFRQNFKQSTIIWVVMMLLTGVIYMEKQAIVTMPGSLPQFFSFIIIAVCIPLAVIALYIFPTLSAFENTIPNLIKNAFYFGVKKIGYAIAVAVITILPMTMTLVDAEGFPIYLFIWLLLGFSLTAYADAWLIWKVFKPYFKENDEAENIYNKDSESDRYAF